MNTQTSCVDKLKLLADTTRLAVLESLLDSPKYVNELENTLDIEQSLLSHHLAQLRQAGLVQATRQGKSMLYQLAPHVAVTTEKRALDLGCCQLTFPEYTTTPKPFR